MNYDHEVRTLRDMNSRLRAELSEEKLKRDDLVEQVRSMQAELERERMRLAGCGVAALGYFTGCIPEYDSASLQDTLRLYAEKERLRTELERLSGAAAQTNLEVQTEQQSPPGDVDRALEMFKRRGPDGDDVCRACGHSHQGAQLAYICIGCPCSEQPGRPSVDEALECVKGGGEHIQYSEVLAAEVERLREESARRNASADGWNAKACELEREARELRAEVERLRAELEQHKRWAGDRNYCDSCGRSILNIVTANAKLARVEAAIREWPSDSPEFADIAAALDPILTASAVGETSSGG